MNARPSPSIGSLCTGYGGLDLAVLAVLGGHVAWVADNDPACTRLLAARWAGVRNLGDITAVDWHHVPRVDVLTAGFPCQDISHAGHRKGITGPRSGVWHAVAQAIGVLRPGLVFVENVAALRNRGLDRVLTDLATLRYDTTWLCLRASDVGAAHRRDRLFLLASPTLPTPCARDGKGPGHPHGLPDLVENHGIDLDRHPGAALLPTPTAAGYGSNQSPSAGATVRPSLARLVGQLPPTPTAGNRGGDPGRPQETVRGEQPGRTPAPQPGPLLPTPRTSDARGPSPHGDGGADLRTTIARYLPTPRASDGAKGSPAQRGSKGEPTLAATAVASADQPPAWGPYQAAVTRWEQVLGRPAPAPTQTGRHGRPVLSPSFVEWLMGLPAGWVCAIGLPRTVALRVLGNGVVPHQAAAALRALLVRHLDRGSAR